MTTTQVKFLLTVQDESTTLQGDRGGGDQRTMDETLKHLFTKLHRQYVEYSLNPFAPLTGPICSTRFDRKITEWIVAYNRAVSS
jgi:Sedlin, N-terminal conserved region